MDVEEGRRGRERPNRGALERGERGQRGRDGAATLHIHVGNGNHKKEGQKQLKQSVNRYRMKGGNSGWQNKEFLKCRVCPHPSLLLFPPSSPPPPPPTPLKCLHSKSAATHTQTSLTVLNSAH